MQSNLLIRARPYNMALQLDFQVLPISSYQQGVFGSFYFPTL